MKQLIVKDLKEGMILAKDLRVDDKIVCSKNTIINRLDLDFMSNEDLYNKKVYIYDLSEISPLFYSNSLVTRNYIGFLAYTMYRVFDVNLNDKDLFIKISEVVKKFLFTNRDLLYQLLVIQDKHFYTYCHSLNVTLYSLMIGLKLGLTDIELYDILVGGIFHDLGKLMISNQILDKPSKLNNSEFKAIERHPIYGYRCLNNYDYLNSRMRDIVVQHHEKLDGSGYPNGLKDKQITYLSKIITVSDIFDAVVSERSYHKSRQPAEGIDILRGDVENGKLDNEIVESFVGQLVMIRKNSFVELSNGQSGFVLEDSKSMKPVIMTYKRDIIDLSVRKDIDIISST